MADGVGLHAFHKTDATGVFAHLVGERRRLPLDRMGVRVQPFHSAGQQIDVEPVRGDARVKGLEKHPALVFDPPRLGFKRGPLRLERCLTLAEEPGEARQPLRTAFHRSPPRDPERERLDEDLQGGLHGEIKQADAAEEHDRRHDEIDRNLRG